MSRRRYTIRLQCAHEGCREWYYGEAETRDEESRTRDRYAKKPWRCTRHTKPDEVLSPENLTRTATLTALPSKNYPDGSNTYWTPEDGIAGSGFVYAPGFKAFTEDFPPGTKLVITATIVLPASEIAYEVLPEMALIHDFDGPDSFGAEGVKP